VKRYQLWCGYHYYPEGGLGDYEGAHHSREEAEAEASLQKQMRPELDWYFIAHVEDDGTLREVADEPYER
jgi:hypothetical protein